MKFFNFKYTNKLVVVSSGTRITCISFQNWDLQVSLVTCLACRNNRAALKGLCTEIPGAIIWLCRSDVSSGNMIDFWPWLLKWEENKWGFQGKGHKKPFCVSSVHCRNYEQRRSSNMYLLSLACQVNYKDCRYPSLAPAITVQPSCWLTLGRISSINLAKKPTELKKT